MSKSRSRMISQQNQRNSILLPRNTMNRVLPSSAPQGLPSSTPQGCVISGNTRPICIAAPTSKPLLNLKSGHNMKPPNSPTSENNDSWTLMAHMAASRYAYQTLLQQGLPIYARINDVYGAVDLSTLANARKKPASRETTGTLKEWLHQHRKNPYPTKGEKIMLTILTKMTLTQVSTWFANARRRLKKENKMTWIPKAKPGDKKVINQKCDKFIDRNDHDKTEDDENSCNEDMDIDDIIKIKDNTEDGVSTRLKETERQPNYINENKLTEMDIDRKHIESMSEDIRLSGGITDDTRKKQMSEDLSVTKSNTKDNLSTNIVIQRNIPEDPTGVIQTSHRINQWKDDSVVDIKSFKMNPSECNITDSAVNNLQRWMNGHFGHQTPVDFPTELTPPRTPEPRTPEHELMSQVPSKTFIQTSFNKISSSGIKDVRCTSNNFCSHSNEATVNSKPPQSIDTKMETQLSSARSIYLDPLHIIRSSSSLTSHREMDAVLALTTLCSR